MEDIFQEDDQSYFLEQIWQSNPRIRKIMMDEKRPDGKPLMSHSFMMIDLSDNSGYPTQRDIAFERMVKYERENMEQKYIYPNVKIDLYLYKNNKVLVMQCDLRLKHRGKYYLTRCFKSWEIDLAVEGMALLEFTNQFHAEVFRYLKFMKVNLKLIVPGHFEPPKRVFELDLDQRSEEERLIPNTNPI